MANKNRNGNGNGSNHDSRESSRKDGSHMSDGPGREGRENGKSGKGFMTYDEVNESMPADVVADQMDDVMSVLGDEDIEIVDAATQVKIAPKRIVEEENAEKKAVPRGAQKESEEDSSYYSKSNDPVRMYLRKILEARDGSGAVARAPRAARVRRPQRSRRSG